MLLRVLRYLCSKFEKIRLQLLSLFQLRSHAQALWWSLQCFVVGGFQCESDNVQVGVCLSVLIVDCDTSLSRGNLKGGIIVLRRNVNHLPHVSIFSPCQLLTALKSPIVRREVVSWHVFVSPLSFCCFHTSSVITLSLYKIHPKSNCAGAVLYLSLT